MSESQLDRIRGDLETIREAAGFSLPFGSGGCLVSTGSGPLWGDPCPLRNVCAPLNSMKLAFMVLTGLIVIGAVGLRVRVRRSTGRSSVRRREYTLALAVGLLVGLLAGYHLIWGKAHGVSPMVVGGVCVSFTGGMFALLALTGRGRRSALGAAVPFWCSASFFLSSHTARFSLARRSSVALTALCRA